MNDNCRSLKSHSFNLWTESKTLLIFPMLQKTETFAHEVTTSVVSSAVSSSSLKSDEEEKKNRGGKKLDVLSLESCFGRIFTSFYFNPLTKLIRYFCCFCGLIVVLLRRRDFSCPFRQSLGLLYYNFL